MTMAMPWRLQLILMVALAGATGIAIGIADGPLNGAASAALVLGLIGLLHYGRDRFDVLNVMSGTGDERTRTLYERASAFAGTTLIHVIVAWWLVTGVLGEVNETLTVLAAVGGLAFVIGAIIVSRRS